VSRKLYAKVNKSFPKNDLDGVSWLIPELIVKESDISRVAVSEKDDAAQGGFDGEGGGDLRRGDVG
jgi:hypothetical protein